MISDFIDRILKNKLQNKKHEVTRLKWEKAYLEKMLEDLKRREKEKDTEL